FPKPVQTLGGYAGTGKTTVIKTLIERLPEFAVCAYTGKAANVLRTKGVQASTIHSLIYKATERTWYDEKGRRRTEVVFSLKAPGDVACAGFIVDEASMVDRAIYDDLLTYGRPIIFVGDHGQLEPVGSKFNLMSKPDVTLTQIHRNAGEIAQFAGFIRQGNHPGNWRRHRDYTGKRVQFLTLAQMAAGHCATDPDQTICAFNKTRVMINEIYREALGRKPDRPVKGDRVMCLQNHHGIGVFNGMQGIVKAVYADEMVFRSAGKVYRVRYVPEQFNRKQAPEGRDRNGRIPFDYCYAVTCHKAQGDEWDDVLVLEQRCPWLWDHKRWAYTAASRARKVLRWVVMDT